MSFTRAFLVALAHESEIRLKELKTRYDLPSLPDRLTACAGIAYAKASQPFYMLHELAEGLCKHAKKLAKQQAKDNGQTEVPSSLSFHRVTTALADDFGMILKRELTAGELRHTLECYAIEPGKGLRELEHLLELQALLDNPKLARGGTRKLLGLIGRTPDQAPRHYKRWREVMAERYQPELKEFDRLFKQFVDVDVEGDDLPYSKPDDDDKLRRSPLGDVITLRSAGNKLPQEVAK